MSKDDTRFDRLERSADWHYRVVVILWGVGLAMAAGVGVNQLAGGGVVGAILGTVVGLGALGYWLPLMPRMVSGPRTFRGALVCSMLAIALGVDVLADHNDDLRWKAIFVLVVGTALLLYSLWGIMRHGHRAPLDPRERSRVDGAG